MASRKPSDAPVSLPVAPVDRWLAPLTRFLHIEAASGIVLLVCTAVALALANSPLAGWFAGVWKTPVSLSLGPFTLSGDVGHLIINDGLMTLFFFVVGLELKRELVHGELRDPRKALLPVFAALGGVLMPAGIYLALQWGEPGQRGWAIPMGSPWPCSSIRSRFRSISTPRWSRPGRSAPSPGRWSVRSSVRPS